MCAFPSQRHCNHKEKVTGVCGMHSSKTLTTPLCMWIIYSPQQILYLSWWTCWITKTENRFRRYVGLVASPQSDELPLCVFSSWLWGVSCSPRTHPLIWLPSGIICLPLACSPWRHAWRRAAMEIIQKSHLLKTAEAVTCFPPHWLKSDDGLGPEKREMSVYCSLQQFTSLVKARGVIYQGCFSNDCNRFVHWTETDLVHQFSVSSLFFCNSFSQ